MGRIQRKKPSGLKKKNKQKSHEQAAGGLQQAQDLGVKKASAGEVVAKSVKKKQSLPQKRQSAAGPVAAKPKDNIFTKTRRFLREVKVELKKVTWPSRKQTLGSTAVVIALVMIISLFLGVVDFGISNLIRIVLQ
jgi:preprotein translocase subunit SecE